MLPDPRFEGKPNYEAASFEELWNTPLFAGSDITFGAQITAALRPGQEVYNMVSDLGTEFGATAAIGPQLKRAFMEGILQPLSDHPRDVIRIILHWAPTEGLYTNALGEIARRTCCSTSKRARRPETMAALPGWLGSPLWLGRDTFGR